jgi:hypothetical protein
MVTTRVDPLGRELELLFADAVSAPARSQMLAQFAREQRDEALAIDERALGRLPTYHTFVDGSEGGSEDSVKPDGQIVYEFDLGTQALVQILAELKRLSPIRSGRYANSHVLLADGAEVTDWSNPPPASEYVVVNEQPYARKIETRGHVYELVARTVNGMLGRSAKVSFGFRSVQGGAIGRYASRARSSRRRSASRDWFARQPAIIVTMR